MDDDLIHINIHAYRNLRDFSLVLKKKKINCIIGVSGSGKSSIGKALLGDNDVLNHTAGCSDQMRITVNGSDELPSVEMFDSDSVRDYLIEEIPDAAEMYRILIDSDSEIQSAEETLKNSLSELKTSIDAYAERHRQCAEVHKALGSSLTEKGELRKSASIIKLEKQLESYTNNRIIKAITSMGGTRYSWILQGNELRKGTGQCPYCNKKMNQRLIHQYDGFSKYDEKMTQGLFKSNNYPDIVSSIDTTLAGVRQIKQDVTNAVKAEAEYEAVVQLYDKLTVHDNHDVTINLSDFHELKSLFPDMYQALDQTSHELRKIKGLRNNAYHKTDTILKRKLGTLNDELDYLDIPYRIEASAANNKIREYKFVHVDDHSDIDRRKCLSNGERNIAALLVFIEKVRKDQPELVIIDDPVSDYDDYRRQQLFQYIRSKLYGMTILILSHDSVYAKYALGKRNNCKGFVYFIQKEEGKQEIETITADDFGEFTDFIRGHIAQVDDQYRKVINLRFLYEGRHRNPVYIYLSGIAHMKTKEEFQHDLAMHHMDEKIILEKIQKDHQVTLQPYDGPEKHDISEWTLIEKAFILRQSQDRLLNKRLKEELNDYVHINGMKVVDLDPYRFVVCSSELRSFINEAINRQYSTLLADQ